MKTFSERLGRPDELRIERATGAVDAQSIHGANVVSATACSKWYINKFNDIFVINCRNFSTCKEKATEEGEGIKPPTFDKECTVSPWESSEKLSNPKLRNLQSSIHKSFSNYKLRRKTWSDYFDNSCKVPRNWCFDQKKIPRLLILLGKWQKSQLLKWRG